MMKRVCTPAYFKDRIRRTDLCKTKAGNPVELLIITNFNSNQDAIAERKCIIVTSRVHPGESNTSFIIEGFLEFIVSNEREAKALRETYVFKIIPMLNPDGVIVGNYRTNLNGLDLNRQWQNPSAKMSPEILAMKEMVKKTLECREIHLFVDMHGHSRQKNLFVYGCQHNSVTLAKNPKGPLNATTITHHKEKILPIIASKTIDWFSLNDCNYVVHK